MSRHALAVLLRSQGFDTYATASAEEALRMIRAGAHPFVALVDLDLPGMSGIELISRLSQHNPAIPAILITAASYERLSKIVQNTNVQYMRKPINFQNLLHLLPPTDYHA